MQDQSSDLLSQEILHRSITYLLQRDYFPTDHFLYVSIPHSFLAHFHTNSLQTLYKISTSKNPPSCIENSLGTPWGLHKICEKIGHDQPPGMIFHSRVPIGQCYPNYKKQNPDAALITSRILRLQGLEDDLNRGHNHDTYNRFVYIHATDRDDLIGQPLSKGCILLSNQDVIHLFNNVPTDSLLLIDNLPLPSPINSYTPIATSIT